MMFVPEKSALKIDMPDEPKGAKWTSAPRLVQSLHYRQDQVGFLVLKGGPQEDRIGVHRTDTEGSSGSVFWPVGASQRDGQDVWKDEISFLEDKEAAFLALA